MTNDPMNGMLKAESRMKHARDELARATNAYHAACDEFVRHDVAKRLAETKTTAYEPVPATEVNPTPALCRQDPGVAAGGGVGDLEEAG